MEVILLQDVKDLGKKDEIVTVNEGYARNFIFKKKYGIEATSKNLNDLKLKKANNEKIELEKLEEAKAFAKEIEDKIITVTMKSGEGGRTFGSISTKEIAKAAKEQLGYDIDKKKLVLDDTIKTLGSHIIHVKIHKDVMGQLTVKVIEA